MKRNQERSGPATDSVVRFGPFEFDLATGELWREGKAVSLQQQPARLLALLVARPGELVSREEIRRHLWSDSEVDAEAGVNFAVRRIRAALGEEAASARFLETLPRRGYRFVAAVESVSGHGAHREPPAALRRWWPLAAGVLLAVAVASVERAPRQVTDAIVSPPSRPASAGVSTDIRRAVRGLRPRPRSKATCARCKSPFSIPTAAIRRPPAR